MLELVLGFQWISTREAGLPIYINPYNMHIIALNHNNMHIIAI